MAPSSSHSNPVDCPTLEEWGRWARSGAECKEPEDLRALVGDLKPWLGFEGWQIHWLTLEPGRKDHLLYWDGNPQGAWAKDYCSGGNELTDPIIQTQMRFDGLRGEQRWSATEADVERRARKLNLPEEDPKPEDLAAFSPEEQEAFHQRRFFRTLDQEPLWQDALSFGVSFHSSFGLIFTIAQDPMSTPPWVRWMMELACNRLYLGMMQLWRNESRRMLSADQLAVLDLQARGFSRKETAKFLGKHHATVRYHLQNIFDKLQVHNQQHAIFKAYKLGLLDHITDWEPPKLQSSNK